MAGSAPSVVEAKMHGGLTVPQLEVPARVKDGTARPRFSDALHQLRRSDAFVFPTEFGGIQFEWRAI